MTNTTQHRIIRVILSVSAFLLAFWWPISHWFYSDWYHRVLGFMSGSYSDDMVKIIGTCGLLPVASLLLCASEPNRYRGLLLVLAICSIATGMTFLHLVVLKTFPAGEWFNVGTSIAMGIFLLGAYRNVKAWQMDPETSD